MKIVLGTAQLGLPYGISNSAGKVSYEEAAKLIRFCLSHGVTSFDTASGYGDSETVLGQLLPPSEEIKIYTKVTHQELFNFEESLSRLKRLSVFGVMLHSEGDLFSDDAQKIFDQLKNLKAQRLTQSIGASFYSPELVLRALENFELDFIQVPYNCLDHRFFSQELTSLYAFRRVRVLVRSIFLQGFFFLEPESLKSQMTFAKDTLRELKNITNEYDLNLARLSYQMAQQNPDISAIVMGFTNCSELEEVLSWKPLPLKENLILRLDHIRQNLDPRVIDPRKWSV